MDSEVGGVYLIAVQDLVLLSQRALRSSQRVILVTCELGSCRRGRPDNDPPIAPKMELPRTNSANIRH